ncbi:MAG: FAD-binding oxidoreductase [Aestuariivirga sp.]
MADKRPLAVIKAKSIADVRDALSVARSHKCPVAVRGGGHSLPGFSTCDGGIVIDLSQMNGITVDTPSKKAVVSGGALLGDLDRAGVPHGLVVPAGVVSHTGAAGLTLGGGMGWLSRRYGLTIDHLEAVELVTADGALIKASPDNEPELFWGLRGGGGNFGIATNFHFRMRDLGAVTAGTWTYDISTARAVLEALSAAARVAPRELTLSFNVKQAGCTVTAFHSGATGEGSGLVSPFGSLASKGDGTCGPANFIAIQSRGDEFVRWGRRYYAKGGYFAGLSTEVIDTMLTAIQSAPTPDSEIYVLQLGGAVSDVEDEATAYTGRSAQFYWIAQPIWDDASNDAACLTWGRKTAAALTALSMEGNYVNEQADSGGDLAVKAYGARKYRRLQALKARFDPENFFRLNQNITPCI